MHFTLTKSSPRKILWIERDEHDFDPVETIPPEYLQLIMPFAGVYFHRDKDCDMLCQTIQLPDFSIWSHEIFAYNDILLAPFTPHHILALHFMEADSVIADIYDRGLYPLCGKEVSLFNLHAQFHKAPMEAGKNLFSFHINISPTALTRLALKYPQLQHLAAKKIGDISGPLNNKPYHINAACHELIKAIFTCRLIETQALYFLHRCCVDLYSNFGRQDQLSTTSTGISKRLENVMHIILQHLTSHVEEPFSLEHLASLFQLDASVIHTEFEKVFFITPEAYAHQQKIMAAYQWLVKTKHSLIFIARRTGFRSRKSLWEAVETYYGVDPVTIRNAQ